jgi:two-component system, cell cycle response regulator
MDVGAERVILVDVSDQSREVLVRRLTAQGYDVEAVDDPATGADMALSAPPAAVIADLWMPSISGVQLCRLLRAEAATADVPVILRGDNDDPRSRFWAERAGAVGYVRKGRMGELVRVLTGAVARSTRSDGFFMQLSGGSVDIRSRIARHLDAALFDSVIAAEVRSLGACGSFDRLFDLFAQFLSQVISYRWLAVTTGNNNEQFAVHHHPEAAESAEMEARLALGIRGDTIPILIADEDARKEPAGASPIVAGIPFGNLELGKVALAPSSAGEEDTAKLLGLVARELGGPIRIAALMDQQRRLAAIDHLTGLRNRRSFLEQAQIEVERSTRYALPLCVMLMDVDHFKAINDSYGHGGGDQVLNAMGQLMRDELRVTDLSGRWGGEEFVIALTSTDIDGGVVAAERIRAAVERMSVSVNECKVPVTASVGLASLQPGDDLEALIDRADRAMYRAKVGGRNRVAVDRGPETETSTMPTAGRSIRAVSNRDQN